jgi:hypothetical protein
VIGYVSSHIPSFFGSRDVYDIWTRELTLLQLFLQFRGPTTLLLQSRSSRLSDSLTTRDINEIADSPAGATQEVVATLNLDGTSPLKKSTPDTPPKAIAQKPTTVKYATVAQGGKVTIG